VCVRFVVFVVVVYGFKVYIHILFYLLVLNLRAFFHFLKTKMRDTHNSRLRDARRVVTLNRER